MKILDLVKHLNTLQRTFNEHRKLKEKVKSIQNEMADLKERYTNEALKMENFRASLNLNFHQKNVDRILKKVGEQSVNQLNGFNKDLECMIIEEDTLPG